MSAENRESVMQVVYDGECPFCSSYVRLVRLKEAVGKVELISARESEHPLIKDLLARGFDLDNGMAVIYEGRTYYGSEAVNLLSVLSTDSGLFNRLMKHLFRHKAVADLAYPFLRFGRNAALFFKGKKQLSEHYKRLENKKH